MWNNVEEILSTDENVSKYVFTADDAVAESVLYKYPTFSERTVICCSTQSGCPVGCRFCGAGDSFVRSLTAEEIVSQPEYLLQRTGVNPADMTRLQIMFMSMGEPLLNLTHLTEALHRLYRKYPNAALLISTSAPRIDYRKVQEVSEDIPTVGLQFSVHESTDERRNLLIPFKKKLSLQEIAVEGQEWAEATGRRPFFNYCAHEGNTSPDDAARLAALFPSDIWEATISVVCERDETIAAANLRQEKLAADFMSLMLTAGYSVRMFNPAGQDDIGGGCGQLWFVQQWMREHPQQARPSIGRGQPKQHAPTLT